MTPVRPPAHPARPGSAVRRLLLTMLAVTALVIGAVSALGGVAAAAPAKPGAAPAKTAAAAITPAVPLAGQPNFGPNVYVFTPDMPQAQIQSTVDAIATQQVPNQFGTQRYALLFEPGTYGTLADPLIFQVGYYTQVAGLGQSPGDVTINGSVDVYNQCLPTTDGSSNCIALDNFWRSLSNLTINVTGQTGCQANTEFWAVSQAAPMRRVNVIGGASLMDYCSGGPQFASGGFIADSSFTGGTVVNGSQQQFLVRNSNLDGWSNGVWNQVFSGVNGAPAQNFSTTSGLTGVTNPYTTLATSPVTQEEPYLYTAADGRDRVFVPAVQHNSVGTTWGAGPTPGTSIPLSNFFIANPSTPEWQINAALACGRNLILTPGVYSVKSPIVVSRPNTIVLGLGFPTIVPSNGRAGMFVSATHGVKLSGLIFDAGVKNSRVLLQVGPAGSARRSGSDPTLVQDVFFRIGGATAGSATRSLVVNSSGTILDNIWAWRADHGTGVGWTSNTAANGVVVNGNNVTAYGLFVEHYQKTQVIWTGGNGEDIFFQSEMPYDAPSQAAWMSTPTTDGYPAFVVSAHTRTFQGFGMGVYCFFENGIPIEAANAFVVPTSPGVAMHDLLTRFLNGSGSIDHVINGTGAAVTAALPGPSDLVSFP